MASGEMNSEEFTKFLRKAMVLSRQSSQPGSLAYYFMDWRSMKRILAAGLEVYGEMMNLCVWAKSNGGMGSFYRSAHELIFLFKNGSASHRNNVQLGKFGRLSALAESVTAWNPIPFMSMLSFADGSAAPNAKRFTFSRERALRLETSPR